MATIVSIRHYKPGHRELWEWLDSNVDEADVIVDRIAVTFANDIDATSFCLRFNLPNATYSPELLNRKRE